MSADAHKNARPTPDGSTDTKILGLDPQTLAIGGAVVGLLVLYMLMSDDDNGGKRTDDGGDGGDGGVTEEEPKEEIPIENDPSDPLKDDERILEEMEA